MENMDTGGLIAIYGTILFLAVLLWLAFREVNAWYWKINLHLKNQQETNRQLRIIAGEPPEEDMMETEEDEEDGAVTHYPDKPLT